MELIIEIYEAIVIYLPAVTGVIASAAAITAITPTKRDDKIVGKIMKFLDFLALNIGNAKNK